MLTDRSSARAAKLYKRRVRVRPRLDIPLVGTIVFTAVLVIFAIVPSPSTHGVTANLPWAYHLKNEPGALRQDAQRLVITRDGKTFFGTELLAGPEQLPALVRLARINSGQTKVYIRADARVRYGIVRGALAQLQVAGVEEIAFLAEPPVITR